jgi:hypothetical protein
VSDPNDNGERRGERPVTLQLASGGGELSFGVLAAARSGVARAAWQARNVCPWLEANVLAALARRRQQWLAARRLLLIAIWWQRINGGGCHMAAPAQWRGGWYL